MTHPILARLGDPDPSVRRTACLDAATDPSGAVLVAALGEALGDPVKAVGRAASDALVEIARRAGPIDDVLRAALHSDDPPRRWRAAFTSARLEPPSPRLLPALVEGLGSPDGDVRWASARLIVNTGRLHGEVLTLLVGLVRRGENPVLRRMATFALRELAPDRTEAAEVLIEATGDRDLHVRRASYTAMASLVGPPPDVADHLLRALRSDPDAATRRLAALALGEIGASDPGAIPAETADCLRQAQRGCDDPDLVRALRRALDRLEAGRPE